MTTKQAYQETTSRKTSVSLTGEEFKRLNLKDIPTGWNYEQRKDGKNQITHWVVRKWDYNFERDVLPNLNEEEIYNLATEQYPINYSARDRLKLTSTSKIAYCWDKKPTRVSKALSEQREKAILGLLKKKLAKNRKEAIDLCDELGI